jgi:hypothetical protein
MGTGNRHPKNWFKPVIGNEMKALADIVERYSRDLLVDATRIFIPD